MPYYHDTDAYLDALEDARADAAEEDYNAKLADYLDPLVDAEYKRRTEAMSEAELETLDEDDLLEKLQEEYLEEAQDLLAQNTPCCNDWHCPCH